MAKPARKSGLRPHASALAPTSADVIERLVAAVAPREGRVTENAGRDRGDGRSEHRSRRLGHGLRDRDREKARQPGQQHRCSRDEQCRRRDQPAFCARCIHQHAGWRLREKPGRRRDRHHDADRCFIPLLRSQQIDRQIRTETALHVGEEKVCGVERPVRAAYLLRLEHQQTSMAPEP
jgi:hypothetical protein